MASLRLRSNVASCNSLYAGMSFLEKQVKDESMGGVKENVDAELRVS